MDIGVLHPPDDGDQLGAGDAVLRMVRQRAILLQLPGELYLFIEHGDIAIVHVSEGVSFREGLKFRLWPPSGHRQPAYRTVQIGHLLPGDKALLQAKSALPLLQCSPVASRRSKPAAASTITRASPTVTALSGRKVPSS